VPKKILFIVFALMLAFSGRVCRGLQAAGNTQFKTQLEKADSLRNSGASEEAQKIYESLLPPLREQGPSADLVYTLNNLSNIATMSGQNARAVALSRESASACKKMQDKKCEAEALDDAGLALLNAGKYEDAAAEFDEGLKLAGETGNKETMVLILNNLGNVYYYEARYSEALHAYESAMQDIEKAQTEKWAATWRQFTQLNLATLYQRLGNDQRAIAVYTDLIAHPTNELSSRDVAHIDANLGALYRRLGDTEEALKQYSYAVEYYAKEKDIDGELAILKNTGIVLALDRGQLRDALKAFERVQALAEKVNNKREAMQALLYRGETLYRMGNLAEAEKMFHSALTAAEQLDTVEEQWKAVYALGRIALARGQQGDAEGKFRDAIKRIESLRSKLQLSRLKSDFLADKRDVYDALIKLLLQRNDAAAAFEYMERSRSRVFQDRFFGASLSASALTLASIQGRLDSQTALVEFWTGPEDVAAIWITRDSAGISQNHLSIDDLTAFEHSVSVLPDNLGKDWQADFKKISAWMPKDIAAFTQKQYQHVLIVPDGFLSLVPFELLPTSSGEPLVASRDIAYLPSAVLLLRGAQQRSASIRFPWQEQLVGFGDPHVVNDGESPLEEEQQGNNAGLLPSSAEEIRAIARLSSGRTKLFLGMEDRQSSFFEAAHSGAALLHVSTHAVADMDDPERSRLLFSPDERGQPNNYVYLKQLYDLDLRGMSLATLSACDTERGRLVPGEGVQAFSRALLAAGSRSALTTLWRVPDQPTAEFMKHFYFYLLKKHKSKAEALRLTKLEFLHSGTELSHPRFWAAFVLNGEGKEPVPRFIPWQALALVICGFGLAVFLYWRFGRKRSAA
jgi:CHAT domain-containing protein